MYIGAPGQQVLSATPAARQVPDASAFTSLQGIPSGRAGTIATLRVMRKLVREAIRAKDQKIRERALAIFEQRGIPPRQYNREAMALHQFVRDEIRYVRDPVGVELVQSPQRTLEIGQGDCDDKSTLLAALLMATGKPARFTAVGFKDRGFSHVMTDYLNGTQWVPMETIINRPAGWFPSGVTSKYSLNI